MKSILSAAILLAVTFAVSGREIPVNELQRIAGGTTAAAGQYPYQVSLRVYFAHFCGASVLNNRWVLTAAHCIEDKYPYEISVIVGTNLLAEAGYMYQADTKIVNPQYNSLTRVNDAGLLRVSRDIVFTNAIKPIPLPTGPFSKANYSAILTGWGSTSENGGQTELLQAVQVTVLAQADCLEKQKNVTATQICSLDKVGVGACNGDGGDPLVADGVQIGVTSIVTPCAKGSPIIYTRVWNLVPWIKQNIGSAGKSYIA